MAVDCDCCVCVLSGDEAEQARSPLRWVTTGWKVVRQSIAASSEDGAAVAN